MPAKAAGSAALCAFGIIFSFASRPFEGLLWLGVTLRVGGAGDCGAAVRTGVAARSRSLLRSFLRRARDSCLVQPAVTGNSPNPPYLEYQQYLRDAAALLVAASDDDRQLRLSRNARQLPESMHLYENVTLPRRLRREQADACWISGAFLSGRFSRRRCFHFYRASRPAGFAHGFGYRFRLSSTKRLTTHGFPRKTPRLRF